MESIESLVSKVKKEIFSEVDSNVHAFVSPSAYDTAWLAMIPNSENGPMFKGCLKWILENQKEGGFWGETNEEGLPTIDALPATLACMLALNIWNTGHPSIQSGLNFIHAKAEILVKLNYQSLPRWFILTFPAMIELAEEAALDLEFPPGLGDVIANIFLKRQHILQMHEIAEEEEEESRYFPPLLSYLETMPSSYFFNRHETVKRHLSSDGSLFQSPSATAHAFISTQNVHCLNYLQSLVLKFPYGVPAKYPMDGDLIKLCIVDHVQGLGLAEYFDKEIDQMLAQVYRNQKNEPTVTNTVPVKLFKEALAFRLLRMNGHCVNPGRLCWFLQEPEMVEYMEENSEEFMSAMYSVYRATDLVFPEETELEEARSFAIKMLQNSNKRRNQDHNFVISKGLQNLIEYELSVPWFARLDRLYHRKWIEENKMSPLCIGKASYYRMSCLDNKELMQLAVQNFEFLQSIYIQELEELKGWSKKWRLSEMGFGREKTVYTYFAIASCSCLAYNSPMRLVIAKAAIIVTVADDFYDMEGSLHELEILTDAVKRWDGEELKGHSKTIFEALDDFVNHIAAAANSHSGTTLVPKLRHIWGETFVSWMVERRWSIAGNKPSVDEYLATGFISIAAHTIALPATNFFNQNSPSEHCNITKLLMAIARLANDLQSYQKEEADGKMNLVLLHLHEHPNLRIEDSIACVTQMLEAKMKEFLQHVFMDIEGEGEDMARYCKKIHLYCMKVFQMFFNSANLFDSESALLDDIQKSIYLPIRPTKPKPGPNFVTPLPASLNPNSKVDKKKKSSDTSKISTRFRPILKHNGSPSFVKQPCINNSYVAVHMKFNSSFIGLPM